MCVCVLFFLPLVASQDTFFIDSPKPHLPIPPNPLLIALYMRLGLTVNPAKYAKWNNGTYSLWLKLAKATDMTLSSKWSDPCRSHSAP